MNPIAGASRAKANCLMRSRLRRKERRVLSAAPDKNLNEESSATFERDFGDGNFRRFCDDAEICAAVLCAGELRVVQFEARGFPQFVALQLDLCAVRVSAAESSGRVTAI